MTRRQRQANLSAMLVGLIATTAVLLVYAAGGLEWLELKTLDLRFLYANSIGDSPDIVCIDIDDTTLALFGRWPWSRDQQAPLISIPAELGARQVLVDLTWNEAETRRSVAREHLGIIYDPLQPGEQEDAGITFPDYVLRAAIAEAGNVYCAYDFSVTDLEQSDEFESAVDAIQRGDTAAVRRMLEILKARRVRYGREVWSRSERQPFERVRMTAALEREPTLDEEALAQRLGIADREFVRDAFDKCRRAALRRIVRRWLDADPGRRRLQPWDMFAALHVKVTGQPYENKTPLGDALAVALQNVLGVEATTRDPLLPLERVEAVATHVEGLTPVYSLHAAAARRSGFVVFEPDSDGVVRRMPMLASYRGRVLAQLALALACDDLGVTPADVSAGRGRLELRPPGAAAKPRVVPLDGRGRALVPWVAKPWLQQFKHIRAAAVCTLYEHREDLRHNQRKLRAALKRILANPLFAGSAEDADVIDAVETLATQLRRARYRGRWQEARDVAEYARSFEQQLPLIEQRVRARAAQLRAELAAQSAGAAERRSQQFAAVEAQLEIIGRCNRANEKLRRVVDDYTRRLREVVAGRICLIGYTATSLPDTKAIPTDRNAPGVMAHANLLNGLLTGRLVGWAPLPVNVALAVVLGIGACLVSVSRPPRAALLIIMAAVLVYVALAGWLAFYRWTYWIHLMPVLGTMLLSFIAIAVYRYFFVDYERRQLSTALSQYTSRSIAEKVAEDPELCRRAEMRAVTAMFTDLKGFTTISERIGAARTQNLLNACLGRFTEVMLARAAMINKFIGDGVFAFWNPVIYPQPDHARLACETACDLLVALRELIDEQRRRKGDEAFGDLFLRIGLATGNAIVGPCGSEQKFDYTCIGDSVNVAARLESANKVYGTQIMVNEETRRQVGESFAFRPLGGVQVKGRRQAVQVAELLGRAGQVDEQTLEYAQAFGRAVALFQQRDWSAACAAFAACAARRPDDLAARRYAAAAQTYLEQPPGQDWNGAIELTEK